MRLASLFASFALLTAGSCSIPATAQLVGYVNSTTRQQEKVETAKPLPTTSRYDQVTLALTNPTAAEVAQAQTLPTTSCTTPRTVTISATYGLVTVITGTSPMVAVQAQGPDGGFVTSQTLTATGQVVVPIFAGKLGVSVRLCNTGANSVTVTSSLSS